MAKLYNRARMTVNGTPGTGTITLLAAFSNSYCSFNEAGLSNGDVVSYFIEDGSDFEIGIGTYTTSGTTLSRDTVVLSKIAGSSGTTKLTLTSAAVVALSPRKEDLLSISETQSANRVFAGPTSGGATTPTFRTLVAADLPSTAVVLQVLQNTNTATTNLTTLLPVDDTIPLSSEGTQVLSQAITLASSSSKVLVEVYVWGSVSVPVAIGVAAFRGTTCINAGEEDWGTAIHPAVLTILDAPATSGSVTYSVRVGPDTTATVNLNNQGTRKYGGVSTCTLTLTEIAA